MDKLIVSKSKRESQESVSSNNLVNLDYNGIKINLTEDGWFNATEAAKIYGKEPYEWFRMPETERYINAFCEFHKADRSRFVKIKRGTKSPGTWIDPRLAVPFARWCDIDFAVWCDAQIDSLLRGTHKHYDWKRIRHEATSSFKVMTAVLQLVRQNQGKETKFYHYTNEVKLINWVITGEYKPVDRDNLPIGELDLMAKLEERNTVLIGCGLGRDDRKTALTQFAIDIKKLAAPAIENQDQSRIAA